MTEKSRRNDLEWLVPSAAAQAVAGGAAEDHKTGLGLFEAAACVSDVFGRRATLGTARFGSPGLFDRMSFASCFLEKFRLEGLAVAAGKQEMRASCFDHRAL